jgi:triosephosphate isomerase
MKQSVKLIAGNWKMNGLAAALAEADALRRALDAEPSPHRVALCPPATLIGRMASALQGGPVLIGGQDCHDKASGAFTGSISAAMLSDAGAHLVIVGHSERRQGLGETDALIAAKTAAALTAGLEPIVCVGETLEERQGNRTQEVVTTQINGSLAGLSQADVEKIVVAYEPVWAIGTGKVATPQQAQEVHALIRGLLGSLASPAVAAKVRIQYGGSVKPDNAADLAAQPDIDGALVGGASLKADDFLGIAKAFA